MPPELFQYIGGSMVFFDMVWLGSRIWTIWIFVIGL